MEHRDYVIVQPSKNVIFTNKLTDRLLAENPKPVKLTLSVSTSHPTEPLEIKSVRIEGVPEDVFKIEVTPLVPHQRYRLDLILPAYRKESFLYGRLLIETNYEKKPVLEIPVMARFGRPIPKRGG